MFIVSLSYKKSLDEVEKYLKEHRDFLDQLYSQNLCIASGPKNPRNGGVIMLNMNDREQAEKIIQKDPFYIHEISDYEFIEFHPNKYHPNFLYFIERDSIKK